MKKIHILIPVAALLLVACSGQYKGIPREAVLAYQTNSTYGELYSLASAYAESINVAVDEDTLHPGMYADYGVALALMGHSAEASRMLNTEMHAFPESRSMILRIKRHLLPDYIHDTTYSLFADTAALSLWAYDSLSALRMLPTVAPVIDSSDREWINRQTPSDSVEIPLRLSANQKRQMLEQQQLQAELIRQARIDSVAAAKQAKIDARKQLKKDKEKAKKEKAKARKQADKQKKQIEKQNKKQREQQAAEKEAQRKQQAAEKEAQRKQQAAEKEAQRKQQAAEKEAQRKQQAAEKEAQRKQQAAEKEAQRKQHAAKKEAQRKDKKGGDQ